MTRECYTCGTLFEPTTFGQADCKGCEGIEELEGDLCALRDEMSDAEEEDGRRDRLVEQEIESLEDMIAELEAPGRLNRARIINWLKESVEGLREITG